MFGPNNSRNFSVADDLYSEKIIKPKTATFMDRDINTN